MAYTPTLPPERPRGHDPLGGSPIPARPVLPVPAVPLDPGRVSSAARHVAEALPFLGMSLDEFQARGAHLELRVPWLDVTLWMVPTDRDAGALMAEGVGGAASGRRAS
jgi:hypothetical protein